MKVVIAMDSMKGSLSSLEAGNAVSEGIHRVFRDAEVTVCPLADGGEGTVEALTLGMNGTIEKINVTGPLGSMIEASYGRIAESNTAIIEMSAAAGITLVNESDRNPLHTTTYGVGELIRDAINKGCRKFIVGIGGSATNDGGIGMLEALGYGFLDADGKQVPYGANGLALIETITDERNGVCENIGIIHAGNNDKDIEKSVVISEVGKPKNVFEGYNNGKSTLIAVSGLDYPVSHVSKLGELAQNAYEERQRNKKQSAQKLGNLSFMEDDTPKSNMQEKKAPTKLDMLRKRMGK